ncbi:hypothetical protein LX16_3765 [Stackebrandtia albiflava]|uniref:DinB family protein n=1 Tax=Stackebrandtia albiflava TaxID=406432 RepID=A0A562V598_9ACTN|nr:hypothetical protein [Stackebrandtia albiflava]TWJ12998.1 hypothetical protein LX16_3765 [Stackebrandtia albiflava]
MTRYLTIDHAAYAERPETTTAPVARLIPEAVTAVLETAESWLGWDGIGRHADGNVWTPHKCLRRVADHLIDHLAEIECRLAGIPTVPDRWHGRKLTTDADWARFTEADLDEATSRLTRLAACYEARLRDLAPETLDHRPGETTWTIREVVHHVSGIGYYAEVMTRHG